jgi:hypothetical protein
MNILWTYIAWGLLTLTAATVVVGGEAATAELKLVETAAASGISALSCLTEPMAMTSSISTTGIK